MALDGSGDRLFVVYRYPATLATIDTGSGSTLASVSTCSDADDVFYDRQRNRVYVSCGSGEVAVHDPLSALAELPRVETRKGGRTSLFVPELDRLFVAVPQADGHPAEVMILAPR